MQDDDETVDEDYRPDWDEIQQWVKDRAANKARLWTDQWLEEHPLDWLMVCRYLKTQVEDRIATAKAHRRLHLDEHGQDLGTNPKARREIEMTRLRRIAFRNNLDDQLNHAKYLLGNDRVTSDTLSDILHALAYVRTILTDEEREIDSATRALDSLMRNLHSQMPIEVPEDPEEVGDAEDG